MRAGLTIEVVQQGLLEHGVYEYVHFIRLQPQSHGDGAHPARGGERQTSRPHVNTQTDTQTAQEQGEGGGQVTLVPASSRDQLPPGSGLPSEHKAPRSRLPVERLRDEHLAGGHSLTVQQTGGWLSYWR